VSDAAGHRILDHTADVAVELWGVTEAELGEQGIRAAIELLTEDTPPVALDHERTIRIRGVDAEDRLVQLLNEVIHLAVHDGFLAVDPVVTLTAPDQLTAHLRGTVDRAAVKTELKSATYHDLQIRRDGALLRVQVVIDV
jgi:SHS2 domain-containing protein